MALERIVNWMTAASFSLNRGEGEGERVGDFPAGAVTPCSSAWL